ncbi:tRNA pseudouridine(38-40) synthase TruA [Hydrogenimonas urashimensis]|uniref:tRNA pseudouridine(38-40) synthase TruA n=1 Tax=Hydrogenimonas urashimensis TaxID=2740515 RepID=UPI0019153DD2|nr:tRNA pseudouridine(38-40) synthase TruA [Hydrogenimonas urashimensis]
MRVKAVVAYDGSAYYGFQSQTTTPKTVSGALARAAARLGIHTPLVGSGRTDRGVHATGQVVHFDLPAHWHDDLPRLRAMFNRLLKPHIQIKHIAAVRENFHARYDARRRIYRYLVKKSLPTPFEMPYCHYFPKADIPNMKTTLSFFEGTHDFVFFHKKGSDPGSTIRTIYRTDVERFGNYTILYLEADGFLRSQVRMIVAATLAVLEGKLTTEQIEEQLAAEARHSVLLAPANGLYLARVLY